MEEHALLLCSLLLGFGLEAYVCTGRDESGPHTWVMTRGDAGSVTCWESLTGKRYELPVHGGGGAAAAAAAAAAAVAYHPYRAISSLFNHECFYVNCQKDDTLPATSLDLSDRGAWRAMDSHLLRALTPLPQAPLRAPTVHDRAQLEDSIEAELRLRVAKHRP